jgi:hypothetical protein
VVWVVVLLHHPTSVALQLADRQSYIFVQNVLTSIIASCPGPEAAKQPQTMMLPPPDFTVGMRF